MHGENGDSLEFIFGGGVRNRMHPIGIRLLLHHPDRSDLLAEHAESFFYGTIQAKFSKASGNALHSEFLT